MNSVHKDLENDAYASHLGIELLALEAGYARARMPVKAFHGNMHGMVHGGAMFSLADFVFQAASNSHGVVAVAVQANITYLQAPRTETLYAEATEVSRTRRLATYSIRVTEDGDKLVAMFQGTVYRMPEKSASTGTS
jgi:acyl-CoA thioesterase